jgi:hypothetical protein
MNVALPPDQIAVTEDRYLQDILVDFPGRRRRRGKVTPTVIAAGTTGAAVGIVAANDPQGNVRYAVFSTASGSSMAQLAAGQGSISNTLTGLSLGLSTSPYSIVDAKPALNGGSFCGLLTDYKAASGSANMLMLWGGANKADYNPASVTASRGSASVTGTGTTFTTSVVPGMFMYATNNDALQGTVGGFNGTLLGQVLSIQSNTALTLTGPSPVNVTAHAGLFTSTRGIGLYPTVVQGTLTCSTAVGHIYGGNTKWATALPIGGGITWDVFRQRDGAYIGRVTSVQSDFVATLTAPALIDMADEAYYAFNIQNFWGPSIGAANSSSMPGSLNATYAGRQWYANNNAGDAKFTSRVWFTDPFGPDCFDNTSDGMWFDIYSSGPADQPIRAIQPVANALLVFKERETWAIYGDTEETFQAKLLDSAAGTLASMSIQQMAGGAIWAGQEGIMFYNGTSISNLTESKLGKYWTDLISTFDSTQYRMWSMLARNHYFLFVENCTPPVGVTKGASTTIPTRITVVINLASGAVTLATNLDIRGSVRTLGSHSPSSYYVVNDSTKWYICSSDDLIDTPGADTVTCVGNSLGPDAYIETRAHDAGDGTRVKRWRWIESNSIIQGDVGVVDAVLGLSGTDSVLLDHILTSSVFSVDNRININWDSQFLAFRIYQNSSSVTNFQIGPYEVGFKFQRVGRPR